MPKELQGVLQDVHDVDNHGLRATVDGSLVIEADASVFAGQKTVTAAGTAEALAGTTPISSVTVKALIGNTDDIHVGPSTVDTSSAPGFVLAAGDTVSMDVNDLAVVYIDAVVSGEGVSFLAVG